MTDHNGQTYLFLECPQTFFKESTRGNCVLLTRWWGCSCNSGRFLLGVSDLLGKLPPRSTHD